MNLKKFIEQNKHLFWDTTNNNLSDEVILEKVIDYGTLDDLRQLYVILGQKRFSQAFVNTLIKDGKVKDRININDYKMIYILAHRLKLNDKIPLGDIIKRTKRTSFYFMKTKK